MAAAIAGAMAHLHARGLMHGDLYAHNILWDPASGDARLGDFGAATRLEGAPAAQRQRLLALEVRAMGCLLDELATGAQAAGEPLPALADLARACQQPDVAARPDMAAVHAALQDLGTGG